jgi:iron complex outermembrane receptor protein
MFKRYLDSGKAPETDGPWQYSGRYSDTIYLSSKISKEIGNLEIVPLLYFNHWTHNHPVTGRINDAETNSFGADLQMNYSHSIDEKTGVLTSGITLRYDDQATDYFKYADIATSMGRSGPTIRQVLSDTKGSLLEKNTRETWLLGIYAQESLRPFQDWLVDAGVRYDMVDFNIKSAMYGDYNWGTGNYIDYSSPRPVQVDRSYNAISPRLGVSWALQPDLHLFTNVSTGVQTPTEGELSENPSLDLVKVQNYEAGVKTQGENWSIDSAVYYSPVEDEVVSVVDGFSTSYINAGKTIKKGLEVSGVLQMSFGLSLTANYSYTDYTFDEFSEPVRRGPAVTDVDRSGNYLPYIPTHQYALSASYRHPSGFKSKIQSQTWGEYYMDNANTEKYEGYEFITSLMLGYETGPWDFTVNIDNLFDKQYATEVTKDTSGERQYNPAAPLSLMARLNYHF